MAPSLLVGLCSADVFGARTDHREEGRERGKERREAEEEWRKTVESVMLCVYVGNW